MGDLIERLRARAAAGRGDKLLEEAAAALEAARDGADAVKRVLAVVEEFEGCNRASYRYMAANIRAAIDQARGSGGRA